MCENANTSRLSQTSALTFLFTHTHSLNLMSVLTDNGNLWAKHVLAYCISMICDSLHADAHSPSRLSGKHKSKMVTTDLRSHCCNNSCQKHNRKCSKNQVNADVMAECATGSGSSDSCLSCVATITHEGIFFIFLLLLFRLWARHLFLLESAQG